MKKLKLSLSDALAVISGLFIAFILLCAIAPGFVAPYSPTYMNVADLLQAPSLTHLFGTDYFGRDVFSVVVYGSRDSLIIGVASVLTGGIIGGILGALAGFIGGVVDTIFNRFIEILMTIPGILLALAIAAALRPSLFSIVLAISVSSIPQYSRVMRGQVISIKNRPYITVSNSIGTRGAVIFVKHVLLNSWSPFLVMATLGLGSSILVASGLSFLGLGIIKEIPDWGTLLSQGRGYLVVAHWICTFPGLVITAFVLAINIIGDRLRDVIDPK
ncbi:MAG: ABC transporter permease [Oscillospiraceae bacterium]|nr:ABC transporter permease [Oscillospiraceae bacterium]